MTDRSKAAQKVLLLRRLAESTTFPEEAKSANKVADGLVTKYGLENAQNGISGAQYPVCDGCGRRHPPGAPVPPPVHPNARPIVFTSTSSSGGSRIHFTFRAVEDEAPVRPPPYGWAGSASERAFRRVMDELYDERDEEE